MNSQWYVYILAVLFVPWFTWWLKKDVKKRWEKRQLRLAFLHAVDQGILKRIELFKRWGMSMQQAGVAAKRASLAFQEFGEAMKKEFERGSKRVGNVGRQASDRSSKGGR